MVVANRVIGRSDRFQRRLSSQEGRAMASRVNREVYARFCGRLEVKFLRPTRRQPPADQPGEPPRFFYPNQDGDGDVDLDPDVLELSFSIIDIGGGTISLMTGENRSLFYICPRGSPSMTSTVRPGSSGFRGSLAGSISTATLRSGQPDTGPTVRASSRVFQPAPGSLIPPPFQ